MRGRRIVWPVIALLAAATTACTATDLPVRACTEIGSPAGVTVTVDRDVVVGSIELTLRICQAECRSRVVDLQPGSITVGESCASDQPDAPCSASSSPDGTLVGFVDDAELSAGDVRVGGTLRTGTSTSVLDEVTVAAEPTYPNGPDCPAGGPQATVRVTATGLR